MIRHIWCLLAISLTPVAFVDAAKSDYGVGFELTLDYGKSRYKQLMRTTDVKNDHIYIAPVIDTQAPLDLQSLRGYLTPWLGGHNHIRESLSRMLKALKTASESYLEASVSTAENTVQFPATNTFFGTIHSTAESPSIQMPSTAAPPAGRQAALHVYGIGPGDRGYFPDPQDPAQLFLTVEHTRAALTALLVFEECGVYEDVRVLHETDLGADSLSEESSTDRQAKLANALRSFTRLAVKGNGEGLKSFSNVVLLGESAGDPLLYDVLKGVLSKQQQSDDLLAVTVDGRKGPIDPVFAASMGAAQLDLIRSNFDLNEI